MLRLNQKITIDGKVLPFVSNIVIKSSRNLFTDTATISLPNRIPQQNKRISDIIKKGSVVNIELGYFPDLFPRFEGYVSQVIPEKTVIIKCEDEAYNVKRQSIGRDVVLKNTDIKTLISTIYAGETKIFNSNIGDWKISKTSSVIDVLNELSSKFRIYSFFRGGTLVVGAQADPILSKDVICHFQKNIPIGQSSFNFKEASADKIVVKATSISRSGAITEVYAYYDGTPAQVVFSDVAPTSGTVNEFNIGGQSPFTRADLQELAKIRLEALSFTGCDGTITIYGSPNVDHGDFAEVIDLQVPEKNSRYSIVGVTTRFGVGIGYRQDLELGVTI